mgnify:CR=1 FL=1
MTLNYAAWQVNVHDFQNCLTQEEKLKFLLKFAVLAPSSHNSQPWRFEIGPSHIAIFPEFKRSLPQSDTNHRQLYISLGCALENILIAAYYFGFQTEVIYFPDGENEACAIRVQCAESSPKNKNDGHLISAILKRHTNRNQYRTELPPLDFLNQIQTWGNNEISIHLVGEPEEKNKIAEVVIKAGIAAMDDTGFRAELSEYVKNNLTKSPIGMPAFGMGIPTPISLLAPHMLKRLNMNRMSQKKDTALLKNHTPLFAIIATKEDDKKNWLKSGQLYEKIALEATALGIDTNVMAAGIQIGEFYKELQKILQTDYRPQIFFRMGYAVKPTKHSPRISP